MGRRGECRCGSIWASVTRNEAPIMSSNTIGQESLIHLNPCEESNWLASKTREDLLTWGSITITNMTLGDFTTISIKLLVTYLIGSHHMTLDHHCQYDLLEISPEANKSLDTPWWILSCGTMSPFQRWPSRDFTSTNETLDNIIQRISSRGAMACPHHQDDLLQIFSRKSIKIFTTYPRGSLDTT